ncbi:MAG: bifunctional DNA-formamidopyrimidine glycosylase/DNA-(apurinic or apyrimidinic site) lyase [Promicromonosporaceae bacterium]|nr:bifunctional DNA-formamidopyrimidine glycosylase/DNA-(apurinic or apyrimidinic site) lyase [Promicromonosporaceae bacterium]
MPELPEVETVRRGLEPLIGAGIVGVQVLRDRSVRGQVGGPPAFRAELIGRRITGVARRGKFLWFPLNDVGTSGLPESALVAHLGMSGQLILIIDDDGDPPAVLNPHLRVEIGFTLANGVPARLDFIDQRTFGYLKVEELGPTPDGLPGGEGSGDALLPESVRHIARDIMDPNLDIHLLGQQLTKRNSEIKRLLMDQSRISGIGNIYADEALWRAQVNPASRANTLKAAQVGEVLLAARAIESESIAAGGTSFDSLYVNASGVAGDFQHSLEVYGRADEPCSRCGTPIKKVTLMNRGTHFCPACQVG